jgi:hypothetical protein
MRRGGARSLGPSQVAFARRIGVPVNTVRNREEGKRAPQIPLRPPCGHWATTLSGRLDRRPRHLLGRHRVEDREVRRDDGPGRTVAREDRDFGTEGGRIVQAARVDRE